MLAKEMWIFITAFNFSQGLFSLFVKKNMKKIGFFVFQINTSICLQQVVQHDSLDFQGRWVKWEAQIILTFNFTSASDALKHSWRSSINFISYLSPSKYWMRWSPTKGLGLTWMWELEFVNFSNLGVTWIFNHLFSINWHCSWINRKVAYGSIRKHSLSWAGRGSIHMTMCPSLLLCFPSGKQNI